MIAANTAVFRKLVEFVQLEQVVPTAHIIRFIRTTAEEKNWLQHVQITEKATIMAGFRANRMRFGEDDYLVFVGRTTIGEVPEWLVQIELNAGLATALIDELDLTIPKHHSSYEIAQHVLALHKEVEGYIGHAMEDVMPFFDPLLIFRVEKSLPFSFDLYRVSAVCVASGRDLLFLPFDEAYLNELREILLEGPTCIPFEGLLHSLTAVHWKYAFLDLYRGVERLFSMARIGELHKALGQPVPLLDLSASLEEHIGWRPKEDDALERLFEGIPESDIEPLRNLKERAGSTAGSMSAWLYSLRNRVVHYRPAHEGIGFDDSDWNLLLLVTLRVVLHAYKKYAPQLEPPLPPPIQDAGG